MKKALSYLLIFALALTMLLSLTSCSSTSGGGNVTLPIDFGKHYYQISDSDRYYVFNSDNTGYYSCYYKYNSEYSDDSSYTLSGRVDFEWRVASNGAVYLFETKTAYNEDHTKDKEISIIKNPIYFSEEFFTYTATGQYGTTYRYIKEGSKLEGLIKD
jgi:hypothetical protein